MIVGDLSDIFRYLRTSKPEVQAAYRSQGSCQMRVLKDWKLWVICWFLND